MLPFGEKVVWMMPIDNQRRHTLVSAHPFGVFAGLVLKTGYFVVMKVAARTIHRLSEDKKCDAEFMSDVKGAPWDFNAEEDASHGNIPERTDARPPVPPNELPLCINMWDTVHSQE